MSGKPLSGVFYSRNTIDYMFSTVENDSAPLVDTSMDENGEVIKSSPIKPTETINIYAGAGENTDLSNFAIRPISTTDFVKSLENWEKPELIHNILMSLGVNNTYQTVEGAFQASKIYYSDTNQNVISELRKKLMVASGAEARLLGRSIKGLNKEAWDRDSSDIMKILLIVSFKQNPNAAQRLLSTVNATLTHTQDKGKWGTEFPRILMEVRNELSQYSNEESTNNEFNNENEFPTDEMNHCIK